MVAMSKVIRYRLSTAAMVAMVLTTATARSAPNTFNTALPVAEGNFIWREQLIQRARSANGSRNTEVSATALVSVLGYGVNARLALFGALPWFLDKELTTTTANGRVTRDTRGAGDARLFGRYTLYQRDWTGRTLRVAPIAGIKAPTGDDNDRDALGRLPRPLQTSTGGWDGFAGVVATYQHLDYQFDTQLLYRVNGRHDGFDPGDQARVDLSLQYRIWPGELTGDPRGFVYALLESRLEHTGRDIDDERGLGRNPDSGGTRWLLAPGLQYVTQRWILEGTVQLPTVTRAHGDGLEDDYIARAGLRYQF